MKVGILTFHNAHNYGAVLQVYALKTVLRRQGHEVVVLNYRNKAITEHYPVILDTSDERKQEDWKRQYERFEEFINQFLLEGNTDVLCLKDLEEMDIDCFISGSDQVWEAGLTGGVDPVYFLDFKTKAKKVSYAASKAVSCINEKQKEYFYRCLSGFSDVSVRENELASELREIGIQGEGVLDPTLLLEAEDYNLWDSPIEKRHEEYILVYYIVEDQALTRCSQAVAEKLKLPLKEIHFYRMENSTEDQMADCGPREFLNLFRNAECILTNSYHGVIFSIIFQKTFYAVYGKDSRKDGLLIKLGLESRHIRKNDEIKIRKIDYTNPMNLLGKEKAASLNFLNNALEREK